MDLINNVFSNILDSSNDNVKQSMNFFERMAREIDFQLEYEKLEKIILNERPHTGYLGERSPSLNEIFETNFRNWQYRENYTSFNELRYYQGFPIQEIKYRKLEPSNKNITMQDFLRYSEMLFNMISNCANQGEDELLHDNRVTCIINTIQYDLDTLNFTIKFLNNNKIIVVQKDAATLSVADIVDCDLSDAVVEYNHYLLKGNLDRKREILKKIADALEHKREDLKKLNKKLEDDFFYAVNSMNIRHNNCDPNGGKNFNKKFYDLSITEKELWYDEIYQDGLLAFLLLNSLQRRDRVRAFKNG